VSEYVRRVPEAVADVEKVSVRGVRLREAVAVPYRIVTEAIMELPPSSIRPRPQASIGWKHTYSEARKLAVSGSAESAHSPAPDPTTYDASVVANE
jgi:hypothetical protein